MPLFNIIKSMSPAEKRHFKLHAGSSGKDISLKYVKLFDTLNKQAIPNETAIEKAGFNAMDKHLLQEKIEESLHIQYLGKNVESKLKWLLESMPRLFERAHWNELQKAIKKAKQLAIKHEYFGDALEAIHWEKEILLKGEESKKLYERFKALVEEETKLRNWQNEELDCHNARIQIELLRVKDFMLAKPESRQMFNQILNIPIFQNEEIPYSTKAKINFLHVKSLYALFNQEPIIAFNYAQKIIIIFETNKRFKNGHLPWYKYSLCLFTQTCHFSGKYDHIPTSLDKIEHIDKKEFKTVCLYGILYAINQLDKEWGEKYVLKINTLLQGNDSGIRDGRKLAIFYNIMIFYSIYNKWKEAYTWLLKILNYKRTDDRKDLQYASRIWSLVCYHELGSNEMDNHVRSVSKYLKTNEQYTQINQFILQVFRDLYKAINRKEHISIFEKLNNYLSIKLKEDEKITQQLGLEELELWCKAKLNSSFIADIIKQQI